MRHAVHPFGDEAFEIEVDDTHDARRVAAALAGLHGVLECVVGWDRVVVLRSQAHPATADAVRSALTRVTDAAPLPEPRTHVVRCVYDGPDLRDVADACGLRVEQVIERHARTYEVEVVGFLPGFAYLGGLDATLVRPRLATPRARIPQHSVGIAGTRTAIYPLASPGGWNLIGRAVDVAPFDPARTPPALFAVGDRVRFEVA